jgi:hypothetical protein
MVRTVRYLFYNQVTGNVDFYSALFAIQIVRPLRRCLTSQPESFFTSSLSSSKCFFVSKSYFDDNVDLARE